MSGNYPEIKKVCIFGTGGVGGYFGGRIADKIKNEKIEDCEVYFIARGEHLQAIKTHGLKVITPERTFTAFPALAVDDVNEIPVPDLFLLCVKSYDLDAAVQSLRPRVGPDTLVVPLLNGMDIYERIRHWLTGGIVLPSCLYLGTHIPGPGIIDQNGGSGTVICGPDPGCSAYTGDSLRSFFSRMGLALDWKEDPYPSIWEKYIFIAAFGLVSAAERKSLGEIRENSELKSRVRSIMEEIAAVAERKNVRLPVDVVEQSLKKAFSFPYETRTSFQRDIESGKKASEGDLFGGAILREGLRRGVPTPVTEAVYRSLP